MNTTTETAFNWIRKIPGQLAQLDEKPLLGFPPPFPWAKYSAEIKNALKIDSLEITPEQIEWRSEKDLLTGIGDNSKLFSLAVAPIAGAAWWAMPEKALNAFLNTLTGKSSETHDVNGADKDFLSAFYQFLALEAINAFDKVDFDKKLSISLNRDEEPPNEPCLGIDVAIKLKNETAYGRLLLSPAFRKSWAENYQQKQEKLSLESPIADSLFVTIHLEAGKIDLKPSEWKQLAIGDYVLLDSCSLDPDEHKGRVMLVINGTPCFRAKLKQGSLKILEHPLYHEVDKTMTTPPKNENAPPEEEKGEEEDMFEDEEDQAPTENPEEQNHEESDEDFDIEDEEEGEDIEKSAAPEPKTPAAAEKKQAAAPAPQPSPSNAPLNVEEIPLPVVIEVGRIQMTVKKLLELQPGNMLELDIHPEAGVDMVVNGKRIARGELMRIGDAFGLRITELS